MAPQLLLKRVRVPGNPSPLFPPTSEACMLHASSHFHSPGRMSIREKSLESVSVPPYLKAPGLMRPVLLGGQPSLKNNADDDNQRD